MAGDASRSWWRERDDEGMVYLQVTRGNPGDRDFAYPPEVHAPTVVLFTQSARPGRQSGREDRLEGDLDPRYPLGPARHQDGAAAVSLDGQDDGQEGRRRRRLVRRGRAS
jgi:hypothetical protein